MEDLIGALGIALALTGALLTAIPDSRIARCGFLAYLGADLPLCLYAALIGAKALAAMYAGFVACAGLGLYLRSPAGSMRWQQLVERVRRMRGKKDTAP